MKILSALATAVSGSLGGITGAHNQGGMYLRARSQPTNPNSARQQSVRANLAAAVTEWGQLTAAQRAEWGAYAANVPVTDSLGQPRSLSGQQMFLRHAIVRLDIGEAIRKNGPDIMNLGEPVTDIPTAAININDIDITCNLAVPASAAGDLIIQTGPHQGPGVSFFKSPFRRAATMTVIATDSSVVTSTAKAGLPFGNPVAGDRLPIRARVCYDDGRLSSDFIAIVQVT